MKKFILLSLFIITFPLFSQHVDEPIRDESEVCRGFDYLAMIGSCAGTLGTPLNTGLVIYYSQTCNHDNPDCYEFDMWQETPIYIAGLYGAITLISFGYLGYRYCTRQKQAAQRDIENALELED